MAMFTLDTPKKSYDGFATWYDALTENVAHRRGRRWPQEERIAGSITEERQTHYGTDHDLKLGFERIVSAICIGSSLIGCAAG